MGFSSIISRMRGGMSSQDKAQMAAAQAEGNRRLQAEQAAAQQAAQVVAVEKQRQAQMIAGAPQQVAVPVPTAAAPARPPPAAPAARPTYGPSLAYRGAPPPMMTLAEIDAMRMQGSQLGAMPALDWRSIKRAI
jgi:hypothetical protein